MKSTTIAALLIANFLFSSSVPSGAFSVGGAKKQKSAASARTEDQDNDSVQSAVDASSYPRHRDKEKDKTGDKDKDKDKDKDRDKDSASKNKEDEEPKLSITEHTVIIAGKPVKYRATAGYMLMRDYSSKYKSNRDDDSKDDKSDKNDKSKSDKTKKDKEPKSLAKMFFIAYTREDAGESQKRPLTFSFNGGPGSASIWLHMGGLGPRRAVLTDAGEALPPPYRLQDNDYSWLDRTDLVFIDPVSTGYSRPEPDEDPKKFHGYQEDIESVGEFIRLYTTKFKRWTSPKFVIGESYGTTRAAGLSDFLQERYGIYLNGIILVSAVLNFATLDMAPGNDMAFALFMPSYTASAWYHKKLAPELQNQPLLDVLKQAEDFAAQDYMLALFQGDRLSEEKKQEIGSKLANFIGLPVSYVQQLNLRVPDELYFTHLLMERNRQIGRYDSRYTGIRVRPGRDYPDFDPSFEAVNGPFTATFNDYVRRDLHFESQYPYETLANVWPWNFRKNGNSYLNVAEDLRKAMIRNPYLKVWICCGHYDLATPYFASKYTVDQMSLDPSIRHNVRLTYYDSGHMLYVYKPALIKFKSDFEQFVNDAILPDSSAVPTASP